MKMNTKLNYLPIAAFAAVAVALAGCGGGSDDPPVVTAPPVEASTVAVADLGADGTIEAGTHQLTGTPEELAALLLAVAGIEVPADGYPQGETVTIPGFGDLTCTSEENCTVVVAEDGTVTTTGTIMTAAVGEGMAPEPVLTELQTAQAAAAAAAKAAMTAAGNADTAATGAETARADAATLQTGETSEGLAKKAREQAEAAEAAYADAKTASEAAAAAESLTDAIEAKIMAEDARDAAQTAETNAGNYAQMSMDAAEGELMIVDTVKSVGSTEIDAGAARSVVTVGEGADAQITDTGLQMKTSFPMTMGAQTAGQVTVAGDPDATPDPYKSPVANAAGRTFTIGKLVDSADDSARLLIVTEYAGTKTVKVFAIADSPTAVTATSTNGGRIHVDDGPDTTNGTDDDIYSALRSRGNYYPALGGNNALLETADPTLTDGVVTGLNGDLVAGGDTPAKAREVFSYVSAAGDDENFGTTDDVVAYVVLDTTSTNSAGVTTYSYHPVNIHIGTNADGDATTDLVPTEVTAVIPEAAEYDHIHFGVWAGLSKAAKSGKQSIADLGIGFVQSIGDGLSGSDMPNNGTGSYSGNWAATVQAADDEGDGDIVLRHGAASLDANFGKGTITATLATLATLKGEITGNAFTGEDASSINDMTLDSSADFEGSFSGGFYGTKAAEAAGVFDFETEDNEGGAFRGAFGAARTDD